MAEGARLESVYTFTRIEGSNPSLTAKIYEVATVMKKLDLEEVGLFLCLNGSDFNYCSLDISERYK